MKLIIPIVLAIMIGNSWSYAAEVDAAMNVDPRAIRSALEEYTVRATLNDNVERVPYGVLLRGAYRAAIANADGPALGRRSAERGTPAIVDGEPSEENFFSQRARDTVHEACRLLRESSQSSNIDIEHIATLMMLSEDQEYEDMKIHYEGLIDELPQQQRLAIQELANDRSENRVSVSFSRVDLLSMARNKPEVTLQLFNLTCNRSGSL